MSLTTTTVFRPTGPDLITRARNLAAASASIVRQAVATGEVVADRDQAAYRLDICRGCTEWFDSAADICRHPKCGCHMRIKTRLTAMRCPAGKW